MNSQDFDYLCRVLKERSGLVMSSDKAYLAESRLMPVARKRGIASFDELLRQVREENEPELLVEVTEAMTTNESAFFADIAAFQTFRTEILPKMLEARRAEGVSSIRIWSAACASGQEPYTLAMILMEEAERLSGVTVEILATDLSTEMIGRAKSGQYTQFEVQRGLPIQLLVKHFTQSDDHWEIDPSIREMVQFQPFNLMDGFTPLGRFDLVFCRNVLVYFDQPTKSDVIQRMSMVLPNDGLLCFGASESVLGISKDFKPMPGARGVYTLVESDFEGANVGQEAVG